MEREDVILELLDLQASIDRAVGDLQVLERKLNSQTSSAIVMMKESKAKGTISRVGSTDNG